MRITQRLEAEVVESLRESPGTCITFPAKAYRPDGSIMIHRKNRSVRLHRYLAEQMGVAVPRGVYLHPNCATTGCMNPFHRKASRRSSLGRNATHCVNGHPYATGNILPTGRYRCRTCRDDRNTRRRKGTRSGGYCGKGVHRLTPANTYRTVDVGGKEHRRCRICTIERMRARRAKNGVTA